MVDDELISRKTEIAMSTLNLPSNATSIRADITDRFNCDGRLYGYYADIENDCQIFHVCLPVTFPDGKENVFRWSFICPENTLFSQVKKINILAKSIFNVVTTAAAYQLISKYDIDIVFYFQESFTCVRSLDMGFPCADSVRFYDLNRNFGVAPEMEMERHDLRKEASIDAEKMQQESKPVLSTTTSVPLPTKRRTGETNYRRQPTKAAATADPIVKAKPTRFRPQTTATPVEIKPVLNRNQYIANHAVNGLRKTPVRPIPPKEQLKPIVEDSETQLRAEQMPVVEEEVKKVSLQPVEVVPVENHDIPEVTEAAKQELPLESDKPIEQIPIEDNMTKLITPANAPETNLLSEQPSKPFLETESNTKASLEAAVVQLLDEMPQAEDEKKEQVPMPELLPASADSEMLKVSDDSTQAVIETKLTQEMAAQSDDSFPTLTSAAAPAENMMETSASISEDNKPLLPMDNTRAEEDQASLSSTVQEMQPQTEEAPLKPDMSLPQSEEQLKLVEEPTQAPEPALPSVVEIQDPVVLHVLKADAESSESVKPAEETAPKGEVVSQPILDEFIPELPKSEAPIKKLDQEILAAEMAEKEPEQMLMDAEPVLPIESEMPAEASQMKDGLEEQVKIDELAETPKESGEELKSNIDALPKEPSLPNEDEMLKESSPMPESNPEIMENNPEMPKSDLELSKEPQILSQESGAAQEDAMPNMDAPNNELPLETSEILKKEPALLKSENEAPTADAAPSNELPLEASEMLKNDPAVQQTENEAPAAQEVSRDELPLEASQILEKEPAVLQSENEMPAAEAETIKDRLEEPQEKLDIVMSEETKGKLENPELDTLKNDPAPEMTSEEQKNDIIKTISSLVTLATQDTNMQQLFPTGTSVKSVEVAAETPAMVQELNEAPADMLETSSPLADMNTLMATPALLDDHMKSELPMFIPVQVITDSEPLKQEINLLQAQSVNELKNHLDEHIKEAQAPSEGNSNDLENLGTKVATSDPIVVESPPAEEMIVKNLEPVIPEKEVTQVMLETEPVEMKDSLGEAEPVALKAEILPVPEEEVKIIEDQPNVELESAQIAEPIQSPKLDQLKPEEPSLPMPELSKDTLSQEKPAEEMPAQEMQDSPTAEAKRYYQQIVELASSLVKGETMSASAEDQPVVHDLDDSAKAENDELSATFSKSAPADDDLGGIQVASDDRAQELPAPAEPIDEGEKQDDLMNNILRIVAAEKIGELVERTDLPDAGAANRIDLARSLQRKIDPRKRRFLFKSATNTR